MNWFVGTVLALAGILFILGELEIDTTIFGLICLLLAYLLVVKEDKK